MKLLSQLILILTLTFVILPLAIAQDRFESKKCEPKSVSTFKAGKIAFQQGDFETAIICWEKTLKQFPTSPSQNSIKKKNHIKTSIYLAAAYQHLGQLKKALRILLNAQLLARKLDDPKQQAMVLSQLGEVYFALRDFGYQEIKALNEEFNLSIDPPTKQDMLNKANETFEEAKKLSSSDLLKAQILNGQGNVFVEQRKYQEAFEKYQEAEESLLLTQQRNDIYETENECKNLQEILTQVLNYKIHKNQQVTEYNPREALIAKIAVNLVQAIEKLEKNPEKYYTEALRKVTRLADSYDKVFSLLTLAQMKLPSITELGKPSSQLSDDEKEESCQILATALKTAHHLGDKRSIAYAVGYLARLYANTQDNNGEKSYDNAIQLTRWTILYTQKMAADFHDDLKLLHTLKWQWGKLLRLKNQSTDVKTIENIYQQATEHFEEIKKKYRSVSSHFSSEGEKFFLDKADFLLKQAKIQEKQEYLTRAIESFESLKEVELQEYFQDYCLTQKGQTEEEGKKQEEEQKKQLEKELKKTAIFYILSFEDRVELLLSFFNDKTIEQKQVKISNNTLTQQIEDFQNDLTQQLEDLQNSRIAPKLKQETLKKLYEWLIKPVTGSLKEKEIETLVIVTHGTLRQMPFAAFYNSEENKYLIEEKYALVITPSLQLTEFKIQKNSTPALLGGTNDFAINPKPDPLEHAEQEISYLTTEVFKDKKNENQKNVVSLPAKKFTIEQIEKSFSEHSFVIVHFSTHGNFSQQVDDTYILVYNEKLKLNNLEKILRGVVDKEKEKEIARQNNSSSVELLTLSACESIFSLSLNFTTKFIP